jgi:hypothetical protein
MANLGFRTLVGVLSVLTLSVAGRAQAHAAHPMIFEGSMPAIMGTAWSIFGDGVIDDGTTERLQGRPPEDPQGSRPAPRSSPSISRKHAFPVTPNDLQKSI